MGLIKKIPWHLVKTTWANIRKRWFTVEPPSGDYILVDEPIEELEEIFGVAFFAPNWETSYNYRGEDLNLARVFYDDRLHKNFPNVDSDVVWWQIHVRGWREGNKTALNAHREAEATEHPEEHINGYGFAGHRGTEAIERFLLRRGIEYDIEERE